ncbi:MAG: acetyl-CoA hydrolase/transferase C-terminal domain-containing protein [Gemmataceae bacterium]
MRQAERSSPTAAVLPIRSGMNVFVQGAAATPTPLLEAVAARTDLEDVTFYHMHTNGPAPHVAPGVRDRFRAVSLFTGGPLREAVAAARADFVPVFLSDIPGLFTSGRIKLDAALLTLSPPDRHGNCSLGTSVDSARAAADTAPILIAEITPRMPRTHGNTVVPLDRLTAYCHSDRPPHEHPPEPTTPVEDAIGALVADLVPDRACLQLGIGGIPNAVLARLNNKQDLGVHSEMLADGFVDLVGCGAVTNRYKAVHPGRSVTSFVNGSRRLYDFVDDNPLVEFHPCDRTNDTALIRKNDRVVAINSAIQIDLTGQVCADSIGHRIYSGIGGQMDFIRGAALSRGGLPVIALPSTAKSGTLSRIVPELDAGAGVVTSRGHVHWVATEYGAVDLHGKSLRERAALLISIAHPDFRDELRRRVVALRHFVM